MDLEPERRRECVGELSRKPQRMCPVYWSLYLGFSFTHSVERTNKGKYYYNFTWREITSNHDMTVEQRQAFQDAPRKRL